LRGHSKNRILRGDDLSQAAVGIGRSLPLNPYSASLSFDEPCGLLAEGDCCRQFEGWLRKRKSGVRGPTKHFQHWLRSSRIEKLLTESVLEEYKLLRDLAGLYLRHVPSITFQSLPKLFNPFPVLPWQFRIPTQAGPDFSPAVVFPSPSQRWYQQMALITNHSRNEEGGSESPQRNERNAEDGIRPATPPTAQENSNVENGAS
jgi:hypothetical protein